MNNIFLLNDSITNGFRLEFVDIIYLVSSLLAILTIVSRNPVVSVLYLIGLFVNVAGLLILMGFNFIGLAYILVYVGAVSILFLFILMLINVRVSELFTDTNNDLPLAILTIFIFYNIIGKVVPLNYTESSIIYYLSNSFSDIYNVESNNELFNVINLKQQIGYASSKGWDNSLIEPTHIASIGNIMYTSYSIWLFVTGIILVLGMVGAIMITIKQK